AAPASTRAGRASRCAWPSAYPSLARPACRDRPETDLGRATTGRRDLTWRAERETTSSWLTLRRWAFAINWPVPAHLGQSLPTIRPLAPPQRGTHSCRRSYAAIAAYTRDHLGRVTGREIDRFRFCRRGRLPKRP